MNLLNQIMNMGGGGGEENTDPSSLFSTSYDNIIKMMIACTICAIIAYFTLDKVSESNEMIDRVMEMPKEMMAKVMGKTEKNDTAQ